MALTGHSLTAESFLALVRNEVEARLVDQADLDDAKRRVERSVDALANMLADGTTIYGVSTGFGGSADTRTVDHKALQRSLVQMLNSGVTLYDGFAAKAIGYEVRNVLLPSVTAQVMPYEWVRGAMLIRINSLLRGHSGTSLDLINALLHLFQQGVTPLTPLRGSISASGDLAPLSYIAGALQGNPDIYVHMASSGQVVPADQALKALGMQPVELGPKEGLALTNGTAFSASVAALATIGANRAAVTAQMLTAMAVEALCGHAESFHPFISDARPHPGQREAARNILTFLSASKLARFRNDSSSTNQAESTTISTPAASNALAQDRYALRTAPQWLGPYLEDLLLATQQIETEMNSTTDNPLIDSSDVNHPKCYNGGNFQACSITSATEKTRLALQSIGKLFFAQCSEMLNPITSNGLPPSCAASDPSLDFACKGLDINMAAYMSELGFLANAVSSHVQSAEMHNQSINSLALISARKTIEALEIVDLMQAAYLYVLCQALDVRVMLNRFYDDAERQVTDLVKRTFSHHGHLVTAVWDHIRQNWPTTSTCDLPERAAKAVDAVAPALLASYGTTVLSATGHALLIQDFQPSLTALLIQTYTSVRERHFQDHTSVTPTYLSTYTAQIYRLVRMELKVPMFQGLRDEPTASNGKKSMGTYVGWIAAAVKSGKVGKLVADCLRQEVRAGQQSESLARETDGECPEQKGQLEQNEYVEINGHVEEPTVQDKQETHVEERADYPEPTQPVKDESDDTTQNGHVEPITCAEEDDESGQRNGYTEQNGHLRQEIQAFINKKTLGSIVVTVTPVVEEESQGKDQEYPQLNGHVTLEQEYPRRNGYADANGYAKSNASAEAQGHVHEPNGNAEKGGEYALPNGHLL